jgi:ACT domain-containing protein
MKKLITERDLEAMVTGKSFAVTGEMILTPSARDYASRHGISLSYDERRTSTNESAMDQAIREIVTAELGQVDHEVIDAVRSSLAEGHSGSRGQASNERIRAAVTHELPNNRAVLSAMGENRIGILSRLTSTISDLGCNIVDVSQTIVSGYFTMILIVELDGLGGAGKSFEQFRKGLLSEVNALGLEGMLMHEDVLRAMHRV